MSTTMTSVAENAPPRRLGRAQEREGEPFGRLIRRCRTRLSPERPSLGPYLRLSTRIGKAVTQEEVAEVVGVSRQWYVMLEGERSVRVSAGVLARIADALMMDPAERTALFQLAVPELRSAPLTDTSTALLEAFGSLRRLTGRLWAASTETEALTLVREYAHAQLAPDVMVTCMRVGEGRWDRATSGDDRDRVKLHALICEHYGPGAIDDFHCYPYVATSGDLLTRPERDARFPDLAELRRVLDAVDCSDFSCAMAQVRSQQGFVAQLQAVHHRAHAFSEVERAQLSALADLVSLAASGCVSSSVHDHPI